MAADLIPVINIGCSAPCNIARSSAYRRSINNALNNVTSSSSPHRAQYLQHIPFNNQRYFNNGGMAALAYNKIINNDDDALA